MTDREMFRIGSCIGWESDECLMAGEEGKGAFHSGRLIYFKKSRKARAMMPPFKRFKIATKGNRKGPPLIDQNGNPVGELALMYALRLGCDPVARAVAMKLLQNDAADRGEPFALAEVEEHSRIAGNSEAFHQFVGDWLATVGMLPNGGEGLRRIAGMADVLDLIDAQPLSKTLGDLLKAVEFTSIECHGVPTREAVREIWTSIGLSGSDPNRENENRFERALKDTGFTWLPSERLKSV